MSRRHRYTLEDDAVTGINVAPLVDVCLVLVIIFMVTTPLLSQPAFKVDLPQAHTQEGEEEDKVTVSLGEDGRIALDSAEFSSLKEMEPQLRMKIHASESRRVVIRADRMALHGLLTDAMTQAKAAGARSLTIATERKR